jgi:hypothetical protein
VWIIQLLNDLILLLQAFIWGDQPCKKILVLKFRFFNYLNELLAERVVGMTNMTVMKEDIVVHPRPTMRKITVPAVEVTSVHARDLIHHVSSYLNSSK